MEIYRHKHVKKDTPDFAQHMFNVLWVELTRDDPMNEEMQSAGVGETFAVPDQVALVAGQQALEVSSRLLEGQIRLSLYLTLLLLGRDVVFKRVLYVLRQAAPILLGQLLQRVLDVRTYAEGNDRFLGHLGRPIVDTGKPSMPMMPISVPMMPMPRLSPIP